MMRIHAPNRKNITVCAGAADLRTIHSATVRISTTDSGKPENKPNIHQHYQHVIHFLLIFINFS
jgi:hypothetical protein